jgi:hypothetical protein
MKCDIEMFIETTNEWVVVDTFFSKDQAVSWILQRYDDLVKKFNDDDSMTPELCLRAVTDTYRICE